MPYSRGIPSNLCHPYFYGKPNASHDIVFTESVLKRQDNDI